jgi:cyd operon protein YbgT
LYFTWLVGIGFAVLAGVVSALWLEAQEEQKKSD